MIVRTESKATTSWPVKELLGVLPKLMQPAVRASKYYTAQNDSLTLQAQTHRERSTNANENVEKLLGELDRIYRERVPNESSSEKQRKYSEL
jgi:peptidyl-tRNA hydrolase ICT1